jgi:hypothetical protein
MMSKIDGDCRAYDVLETKCIFSQDILYSACIAYCDQILRTNYDKQMDTRFIYLACHELSQSMSMQSGGRN